MSIDHLHFLERVGAALDILHYTIAQKAHLQCGGHCEGELRATFNGRRRGCRLRTVGGIDQLGVGILRNGQQRHVDILAYIIDTRTLANPGSLDGLQHIVLVVLARNDFLIGIRYIIGVVAAHHTKRTLGTRYRTTYVSCSGHPLGVGALVVDADQTTHLDHVLDLLLAVGPVLQEHTRCARHSQHPGIEGNGILADRILRSSCRTILGVVILDECHRILTIIHVADARVVLQVRPIVVVHSIAASVAESEVEGC